MLSRRQRLRILVAIAFLAAVLAVKRFYFTPPVPLAELAYTECPFRGAARVRVLEIAALEDTFPVRMHEEAHAAQ